MADLQPTSLIIVDLDADVSVDSECADLAAREAALACATAAEQDTTLARAARERAATSPSPPVNDIISDDIGVTPPLSFLPPFSNTKQPPFSICTLKPSLCRTSGPLYHSSSTSTPPSILDGVSPSF
jgi:hypothetical protein